MFISKHLGVDFTAPNAFNHHFGAVRVIAGNNYVLKNISLGKGDTQDAIGLPAAGSRIWMEVYVLNYSLANFFSELRRNTAYNITFSAGGTAGVLTSAAQASAFSIAQSVVNTPNDFDNLIDIQGATIASLMALMRTIKLGNFACVDQLAVPGEIKFSAEHDGLIFMFNANRMDDQNLWNYARAWLTANLVDLGAGK